MSNSQQSASLSEARVTVLDGDVIARNGAFTNDKGENIAFSTRKQKARLEAGGFAYPYDVRLDNGQQPYAPGEYVLDLPAMLQVNKGSISLNKFPILRRVAATAKA